MNRLQALCQASIFTLSQLERQWSVSVLSFVFPTWPQDCQAECRCPFVHMLNPTPNIT